MTVKILIVVAIFAVAVVADMIRDYVVSALPWISGGEIYFVASAMIAYSLFVKLFMGKGCNDSDGFLVSALGVLGAILLVIFALIDYFV